jgi:outer membrane protein assembly factor BamB
VATELQRVWSIRLGGRLTQPIAAGGRVFVADVERNSIHAIDASSGDVLWSFTVGGQVDTPPTFDRGRIVFGSADGYVYCLQARDGALAWRFRAAPVDRRTVAFERLESVWPVNGSVLVQDGVVSFVAGRSMYLDGGLRLCRLDVATGRLLSEKVLDDRDPETQENLQVRVNRLNMPVALPDILSSDGECLFMRSQVMDLEGNRLSLGPGKSGKDHLFAAYGFTDDSWFHRTYWLYGDGYSGGVGGFGNAKSKPAGRILVNSEKTVFGYGRKLEFYRWSSVADYHLFAAVKPGSAAEAANVEKAPKKAAASKRGRKKSAVAYRWTRDISMMVRAMALAGDQLLIAGPPDSLDEAAAFQTFSDQATQRQLVAQDTALKGQSGALFQTVDANTGETLAEHKLESPPVFDGLIVAEGQVFIATVDGRLSAYSP